MTRVYLSNSYTKGWHDVFEKLGVSPELYLRAIRNAATAKNVRIAPSLINSGEHSIGKLHGLSNYVRSSGPAGPVSDVAQKALQRDVLNKVDWAGKEINPVMGFLQPKKFDRALQATGRTFSAPNINQDIQAAFGPSEWDHVKALTAAQRSEARMHRAMAPIMAQPTPSLTQMAQQRAMRRIHEMQGRVPLVGGQKIGPTAATNPY